MRDGGASLVCRVVPGIVPGRAPRAKEGTVHVSFPCGEDDFLGARITYEPEPRT